MFKSIQEPFLTLILILISSWYLKSLTLFGRHRPPCLLLCRMTGFVGQHSVFSPAAAAAFLASDFFDAGAFSRHIALLPRLDFIQQEPPSKEAVEPLLSRGLAFDLQARGSVEQHHTR